MEGGGPPHAGQGLTGRGSLRLAAAMPPENDAPHHEGDRDRALEVLIIVNNGAIKGAEPRAGPCAGVARERINPDSHHRDPGWARDGQVVSAQTQCSSHHFISHPPRHPTPSTPEHLNLTFVPRRAPVPPAVRHPLGACQSRGAPGPHRRRSTSLPAVRTQEQEAPRSWRGQRAGSGILLAVCFCRKAFLRSTLVPLPLINARDFD